MSSPLLTDDVYSLRQICPENEGFVPRLPAPFPDLQRTQRQEPKNAEPLPVLLLRYGLVSMRGLTALHDDQRFELFVTDNLTGDWASFAQRVAGTFIVTEDDPMSALVYAVTGGIRPPMVMMFSKRYRNECKDLATAGVTDCITLPVTKKDLDRLVPLLAANASLSHIDGTLRLLLDPIARTARFHEKCVRLSQREFAVLQCMSSFQGRPVAAHKLLSYVWGDRPAGNRPRQILDVYIFQLRKKLERLGLKGAISTVRGVGYALVHVNGDRASSSAS